MSTKRKGTKGKYPKGSRRGKGPMAEERQDRKYQRKSDSDTESMDSQKSRNDVSWYSRNPALLMAAGSIPFPYRPGMIPPWGKNLQLATTGTTTNGAIPGIYVVNWVPTVGHSELATDPASIVGKEIFAKVREKFSGSIDADAPDFVIYLMALDSIFSYIASLKRVYRVLTAYTSENHYIPDGMMNALGFSSAQTLDLKEHRMQFFQIINELVYMTRKFIIPDVFDIMRRHYWLNDNVYMDADSINSQFYVFHCTAFYQFEMKDISSGVKAGGLTQVSLSIPATNVAEYLFTFGRALIDALAGSDDAYIISGYLMRAYEGTAAFGVDELPIDDKLIPHYDPEVLMQIENAFPVLYSGSSISNDVTQNPSTNAIVCTPTATGNLGSNVNLDGLENFLSIRSDVPTVADVTIATRLKMGWENFSVSEGKYSFDIICGSEIVTGFQILNNVDTGNGIVMRTVSFNSVIDLRTSTTLVNAVFWMQSFDWHPIVLGVYQTFDSPEVALTGDLHNSTILTNEALKQLNRVCLYSEFNAYGQI